MVPSPGSRRPRRRDRHGRGLRGPLSPPQVPLSRSRAERFDELVLEAVERLEDAWSDQLAAVELAVEDVPPADPDLREDPRVPLGRTYPAGRDTPARIVVYRRPVEARAPEPAERAALVHDVVVEQLAELLGLSPEEVDPGYAEDDDED